MPDHTDEAWRLHNGATTPWLGPIESWGGDEFLDVSAHALLDLTGALA